jgi:hypothetical protein
MTNSKYSLKAVKSGCHPGKAGDNAQGRWAVQWIAGASNQASMKHKIPILVVIGTEVGKSLLFMLPGKSMSSGTTVVIRPLVS